jgi:hypothetical protein
MYVVNAPVYYDMATITDVKGFIVQAARCLQYKSINGFANKRMAMANTLAYYDMATITDVKGFIVQAAKCLQYKSINGFANERWLWQTL